MSKDGFVTPEELDALAESCAKRIEDYVLHDLITAPTPKEIIRSAIDQALSLQRESVIEECAQVCIERANDLKAGSVANQLLLVAALAIRALKG